MLSEANVDVEANLFSPAKCMCDSTNGLPYKCLLKMIDNTRISPNKKILSDQIPELLRKVGLQI